MTQTKDSESYVKDNMRNDHLKGEYLRINQIPKEGYLEKGANTLEEQILSDTRVAALNSLACYHEGSSAKPGTIPHDISLKALDLVQRVSNPNGVDREMFRGSANREKDVISMISRLFGKNENDELEAGYLLSGGTESLNQVSYMLRNKYFIENKKVNIRELGLAEATYLASQERIKEGKGMIKPKVLLPPNYHFSGIKGTDLLGIGANNLAYYNLDQNFDIDKESLRNTIKETYESGEDIMYALAVAGDTMHGKVHDINLLSEVLNEMSEKYNKPKVPIVVDAAGSFMFIGVMKDDPKYNGKLPEISFKTLNLEAIVGDPHKQPIPYSCGLLMLKDMELAKYTDVRKITKTDYLDMDKQGNDTSAALATIPTSRSGSNAFAAWAYIVYQGMTGLRKEKEKIWDLVQDFKEYINSSKDYELVCEPQTQVVSFRYKGTGEENIEIYQRIKHSDTDYCYISHDTGMLVRTKEEIDEADQSKDYTGLFVTIMEHNTQKNMNTLKRRLDEEAELLRKQKSENLSEK